MNFEMKLAQLIICLFILAIAYPLLTRIPDRLSIFVLIFGEGILLPSLYVHFLRNFNINKTRLIFTIWIGLVFLLWVFSRSFMLENVLSFLKIHCPLVLVGSLMLLGSNGIARATEDPEFKRYGNVSSVKDLPEESLPILFSICFVVSIMTRFVATVLAVYEVNHIIMMNWPNMSRYSFRIYLVTAVVFVFVTKYIGVVMGLIVVNIYALFYKKIILR